MSKPSHFKFRLYVAGDAANSVLAIANLTAICRTHAPGRHEIEIVDVLREPERALVDEILLTPTLIKLSPGTVRRIVGTLRRTQPVLDACGMPGVAA